MARVVAQVGGVSSFALTRESATTVGWRGVLMGKKGVGTLSERASTRFHPFTSSRGDRTFG